VHLAYFGKIGTGDIELLMKEVENSEKETAKRAEQDEKKEQDSETQMDDPLSNDTDTVVDAISTPGVATEET
jgi:hypothetical protein